MGSPNRSALLNDSQITTNSQSPPILPPILKRVYYINFASSIPTWSLGIPLLILDSSVWSILAFVWSNISSITSLYRVRREETYEYQICLPGDGQQEQEPLKRKHTGTFACVDFVLGVGLLSWVILSLLSQTGGRWMTVLMAYISVVWFGQAFLHLYFLYRFLGQGFRRVLKREKKGKVDVLCVRCGELVCDVERHEPSSPQMAEGSGRGREALF